MFRMFKEVHRILSEKISDKQNQFLGKFRETRKIKIKWTFTASDKQQRNFMGLIIR